MTTTEPVLDAIDEILAEEHFSSVRDEDEGEDLPDRPPPGWCED